MKLYFSPSASSLSQHINLREAALPFELERVDLGSKKTATGADFRAISPKGYVPALQLDDGQVLTENLAIAQYVADLAPASKLAPAPGTLERVRLLEWLAYLATEVHKNFGALFDRSLSAEARARVVGRLTMRLALAEQALADKPFLMGDTFTVADSYLFTCLRWSAVVGFDLASLPHLAAFLARVGERPAVQAALAAEKG